MFDPTVFRCLRLIKFEERADTAKAVKVSRRQVWNYENGVHAPSSEVLARIAAHFGVPVEWFDRPDASGLTSDEIHEVVVRSRLRQGLPPRVLDPVVLDHIAVLLTGRPGRGDAA